MRAEKQELAAGASLYQEIAPSFGLRHWFFDEPGTYEVQANVRLADGRRLSSPVRRVRILRPTDATDRLAPDFFVNEVGMYLGVEGSRIDAMKRARDLTKEACERAPKAAVAQQIGAVNALRDARVFKDVRKGEVTCAKQGRAAGANDLLKRLGVSLKDRKIQRDESRSHLRLTRRLALAAQAFAAENEVASAQQTLDTYRAFLRDVKAPKHAQTQVDAMERELKIDEPNKKGKGA